MARNTEQKQKKEQEIALATLDDAYALIPEGFENSISIASWTKKLESSGIVGGRDSRRTAQRILKTLRQERVIITLNTGVFVPVAGDEEHVRHYINRETHRITEISANLVKPREFLIAPPEM